MSLNKFVAGTVLATPAVGGGSYVIYEELTKEATNSSTTSNSDSQTEAAREENGSNHSSDQTDNNVAGNAGSGNTNVAEATNINPQSRTETESLGTEISSTSVPGAGAPSIPQAEEQKSTDQNDTLTQSKGIEDSTSTENANTAQDNDAGRENTENLASGEGDSSESTPSSPGPQNAAGSETGAPRAEENLSVPSQGPNPVITATEGETGRTGGEE